MYCPATKTRILLFRHRIWYSIRRTMPANFKMSPFICNTTFSHFVLEWRRKKYWFLRWSWPVWKSIPVIFTRVVENQTTVLWSRSMIQMDSVGIFTLRLCSFIWEVTVTQWPSSPNGTYCFLLRIGKWGRQMVHPSGFGVPQRCRCTCTYIIYIYIYYIYYICYIYIYLFTYTHDIFCDPNIQNMCTCMQCNVMYVM